MVGERVIRAINEELSMRSYQWNWTMARFLSKTGRSMNDSNGCADHRDWEEGAMYG